ncbi:hypothetical protein WJX82_002479 [Trebouxia sp. C0006]
MQSALQSTVIYCRVAVRKVRMGTTRMMHIWDEALQSWEQPRCYLSKPASANLTTENSLLGTKAARGDTNID